MKFVATAANTVVLVRAKFVLRSREHPLLIECNFTAALIGKTLLFLPRNRFLAAGHDHGQAWCTENAGGYAGGHGQAAENVGPAVRIPWYMLEHLPPMATLLTHAFLGAALGQAAKPEDVKPGRFWALAAFCSMLPDIDVVGFRMGIPYGALWGHRGLTHSLLFAAIIALPAAFFSSAEPGLRWKPTLLLFGITASHGLLDAMTNGGLGVAFFSPFNTQRYFLPWRPIAVSPIGIRRFASPRGIHILWTEAVWVWAPVTVVVAATWLLRRPAKSGSWGRSEFGAEE